MDGGFYDAVVVDTADPTGQGRARLQIPQISGTAVTGWARPMQSGWSTAGDLVYAAFKGGDPDQPIYMPATLGSPWLPIQLSASYVAYDDPMVRYTADGYLELTGYAATTDPPTASQDEVYFGQLPESVPSPIRNEWHICATDSPNEFTAQSAARLTTGVGTTTSAAYTATLTGAADTPVQFTAPGSGTVLVTVGVESYSSSPTANSFASVRITAGSPTGTVAYAETDDHSAISTSNIPQSVMTTFPADGLSPGQTYYATPMYRTSSSSATGNFVRRAVRVDPVRPYSVPVARLGCYGDRSLYILYPYGSTATSVDIAGVRLRYR